jgi:CRP/FNR family transcriptional regulator, nitrogen fixation regulation protein
LDLSDVLPSSERRDVVAAVADAKRVAYCVTYCADEYICGAERRSAGWYRVLSGAARCCAHLVDGRRSIIDFLVPGDLFRVHASPVHRICFEAVVTTTRIARYTRRDLEAIASDDRSILSEMLDAEPLMIRRLQAHALMLGHASAIARVAAFLLEFSGRFGLPLSNSIVLPMSRSDIADYLGIAVESVSRALTQLRRDGVIDLRGPKRIQIATRSKLEQLGTLTHAA